MIGTKDSLCAIVQDLVEKGKVRCRIFLHLFPLFLTLPRRVNFWQLAQYGSVNRDSYHNWFKQKLDLSAFNLALVDKHGSGEHFVIFDPCFLPKSGKRTPHLAYHWSGCSGRAEPGLEIGGFAIGDLGHATAFHFTATLTPCPKKLKQEGKTLLDHYASLVKAQQGTLQQKGNLLVVDGYFGVYPFVKAVVDELGIDLISSLRVNAVLFYPPPKRMPHQKGRPAQKGNRIRWDELDCSQLPLLTCSLSQDQNLSQEHNQPTQIRSGKVYVKALKRWVLLVVVESEDGKGGKKRKLLFTTNLQADPSKVLAQYRTRFQIEFLYRDAKQFTGLTHCQSTDEGKLETHINLSLSTVNLAKVAHWLPIPKPERGSFSMAAIKAYYYKQWMVERVSTALGFDPNLIKNKPAIKQLLKQHIEHPLAA